MIYPCNDCGQSGLIAARGLCSGCVEKILRRLETARPEALRSTVLEHAATEVELKVVTGHSAVRQQVVIEAAAAIRALKSVQEVACSEPFAWVVESESESRCVTIRKRDYHDTESEARMDQERHGGKVTPLFVRSPLARSIPIAEDTVPMLDALNEPCKNCGKKPIDLLEFS